MKKLIIMSVVVAIALASFAGNISSTGLAQGDLTDLLQGLSFYALNHIDGKAYLLTSGGASPTTNATITYTVNGVYATMNAGTACTFKSDLPVQAAGTYKKYMIQGNASGVATVSAGIAASSAALAVLPYPKSGFCPIAYVQIVRTSLSFTPGVTSLNATGITARVVDLPAINSGKYSVGLTR